jgi:hypothetical protein
MEWKHALGLAEKIELEFWVQYVIWIRGVGLVFVEVKHLKEINR